MPEHITPAIEREIRGWLFPDGCITAEGVRYVPAAEVERAREQANEAIRARNRAWDAIAEYRLWRPGEKGHAAAHRKLMEVLDG